MDRKYLFDKKILYVFFLVFFLVLFMVYEDPFENIFLVISLFMIKEILKNRTKNINYKRISIYILVVLISYVLSVTFIFSRSYDLKLEKLYNKDNNKTAVLLVYRGEGDKYDVSKISRNIILEKSNFKKLTLPFILYDSKTNYRNIGKSNYKLNTVKVKEELQSLLEEKVYIGYLYDKDYVEEKLIDIVNDGYHKIIIVPVFLTEGEELSNLKGRIELMKLFNLNITIKYTESLWHSEDIVLSYVKKILNNISVDNKEDVGVVLIGDGKDDNNEETNIRSIKQDVMFRNKLKLYLSSNGEISQSKIKLAWLDELEPSYIESVKDLLGYSVGEIISIYVNPEGNYIETSIITKKLRDKIEVPEGVKLKVIDGFLQGNDLIYELKNRVMIENLKRWD